MAPDSDGEIGPRGWNEITFLRLERPKAGF